MTLRAALEYSGKTLADVADATGYAPGTIRGVDRTASRRSTVRNLARVLGVPESALTDPDPLDY